MQDGRCGALRGCRPLGSSLRAVDGDSCADPDINLLAWWNKEFFREFVVFTAKQQMGEVRCELVAT